MRDFAMPPDDSSPAHAHLAAVVRDSMDDLPARLAAVGWLSRSGRWRFVVISTVPAAISVEPDLWWGTISRRTLSGHRGRDGSVGRRSDVGFDLGGR